MTLYIPKFLKRVLSILIRKAFCDSKKQFIRCTPSKAYFSDSVSKYKGTHILGPDQLIELSDYLIDNCCIGYKGKVFKQCVGIPMGIDPAPFMANLFLFYYEHEYMLKLISSKDSVRAKKLSKTFRYLDDLLALNDSGVFKSSVDKIYPTELKLSCTDVDSIQADYLDLDICISSQFFRSKLFDKRDQFDFKPISYPCLTYSNVSSMSSYGIYLSQILRICRICTKVEDFEDSMNKLTHAFASKGFDIVTLRRYFMKFIDNYTNEWTKFGHLIALPLLLA